MDKETKLKRFLIEGYSDRKFYAYVMAKDKKEAEEKAKECGEWEDEETESEDFHDIEVIGEEE